MLAQACNSNEPWHELATSHVVSFGVLICSKKAVKSGGFVPEPFIWELRRPPIGESIINKLNYLYIRQQATVRPLFDFNATSFIRFIVCIVGDEVALFST